MANLCPVDFIKNFEALSVDRHFLEIIRLLLNYPVVNWVSQYFSRTRDAKNQLNFVQFCRDVIDIEKENLSDDERSHYDKYLIFLELAAYDRLNDFDNYISLFEWAQSNMDCKLPTWRYEIIKRKKVRQSAEKLPERMLRHTKEQLSDEELNNRLFELKKLLYEIVKDSR